MKTISRILLVVSLFAVFASAEKVIWHRSYFLALGLDASFSMGGDLTGKGYSTIGEESSKQDVYVPYLGSFVIPGVEAGVNFNQHTISISFGMWQPDVNYGKETDRFTETDANYWRFAAEYRYFFFWPEDFEVGPGLSYTFSRYSVHSAAFGENRFGDETRESAIYSGNSFAASANLRYKLRPFGIDVAFRYRAMFIRGASTDENGYSQLDETLWQHLFEVGAKFFYEF